MVLAIVVVATLAVVAFGVPLGVVIDRQFDGEALLRLERAAILAERDLPPDWRPGDPAPLDVGDDTRFGLYDANGMLVTGVGPSSGDAAVAEALEDEVGEGDAESGYTIAVPVIQAARVVGVLRAEQDRTVSERRTRAAWAAMALLAFAVVGGATGLAAWLARRIAIPIESLQRNAARLGTEGETVTFSPSGMAELDGVAEALRDAAARVSGSVERERAFSAEVSHQLRTPITALRLLLETELVAPRPDRTQILVEGLRATIQLESTVEELLLLGRERPSDRGVLDVGALLADLERRWRPLCAAAGRSIEAVDRTGPTQEEVRASSSAVRTILDVLVDNAMRHGTGEVHLEAEGVQGGVAIRVRDEGTVERSVIDAALDPARGAPGSRIGLRLARRLAHAERAELLCTSARPTTISLVLMV
jgi:signal transduction histidine kinase